MAPKDNPERSTPYHHGDLRAALISAALDELEETGPEGFSLRKLARRAGVSHAAPAHHFGDLTGLLSAVAAEGYRKFVGAMIAREQEAEDHPGARLTAAGLGYVDFAMAHPALFRLIHSSQKPDQSNSELYQASAAAFDHIVELVSAVTGTKREQPETMADVAATWAMAHGIADLLVHGRLKHLGNIEKEAREAAIAALLSRSLKR